MPYNRQGMRINGVILFAAPLMLSSLIKSKASAEELALNFFSCAAIIPAFSIAIYSMHRLEIISDQLQSWGSKKFPLLYEVGSKTIENLERIKALPLQFLENIAGVAYKFVTDEFSVEENIDIGYLGDIDDFMDEYID